jgi:hypothetical protein
MFKHRLISEKSSLTKIAAVYGEGNYSSSTYNSSAQSSDGTGLENPGSTTGGSTGKDAKPSGGSDGLLTNTGYEIILPVALGLAIILASVIMLIKSYKTNKQ